MMDLGGNILTLMYVWVCWQRGTLDDNEPIHESWDANKPKTLSCVLTVKWPFSYVETVEIITPLLCSKNGTLLPLKILQTS